MEIGWIAGGNGTVLRTTDGGDSWNDQSIPANDLHSIYFISENMGWIVGLHTNYDSIFKTVDGGISWTPQTDYYMNDLYSVCFTSSQYGWAAGNYYYSGNGAIEWTIDGGNHWNEYGGGNST